MRQEQYERIKEKYTDKLDYAHMLMCGLKRKLADYERKPYTKAVLAEIDYHIQEFIKLSELNVNVIVTEVDRSLIIMGATLEDELIWHTIQQ